MPYMMNWLIPNEVIYVHYSGVTTAEELHDCLLEMVGLMDSSQRTLVHVINDVGDITEVIPFKDSIKVVREVGPHPRAGWTISIREKSLMVKMGTAFGSSLFKLRYRAFDSLEDAVVHLKHADETINWDKIDKSVATSGKN